MSYLGAMAARDCNGGKGPGEILPWTAPRDVVVRVPIIPPSPPLPQFMGKITVSHQSPVTDHALLNFRFADDARNGEDVRAGSAAQLVALPALTGDAEVWFAEAPVERGTSGPFETRCSGDLLALTTEAPVTGEGLRSVTRRLYLRAIRDAARLGYPHPVRFWNYLPDIHGSDGDGVRRPPVASAGPEEAPGRPDAYRSFCVGRAEALQQLAIDPATLPAASALGSGPGTPFQLIMLASNRPGVHIENPRQTRACLYPRCYGLAPPAFARATLWGRRLLMSGTAAIVGHASQHQGAVGAQLRCTLDNLLMLMDHACAEGNARRVVDVHARVYLRHAEDLASVREALGTDLPNLASAVYLQAEICRPELLVEVEATGTLW